MSQNDSESLRVFHPIMDEVRDFIWDREGRALTADPAFVWPEAGPRDIVLLPDLAVELGHPDEASAAFLVWTEEEGRIHDNTIRVIGPDVCDMERPRMPFGKVVMVRTRPWDEDTSYQNYLNLDLARFEVSLKGYMLRAASQHMREWARISKDAVEKGFSFQILGSALIKALKARPEVLEAEVIFVTRAEDVETLIEPCEKASRLIGAMNKMAGEMESDCGVCEYQDVCSDAEDMQALRERMNREKEKGQVA